MSQRIVEVSLADDAGAVADDLIEALEEASLWVLAEEGVEHAFLSIALLSDDEIASLNDQYLSHSGPTDVISFPLGGPQELIVGDIYIGLEQARRQSADAGEDPDRELVRLAIHGTLHVLGWEHPEGEERLQSEMYQRQESLLQGWWSERK